MVDQVVITNGEGGYRFSTLAERIYGEKLTNERTGRARLPQIRRRETLAAGKILGIRDHHFLGQCDARFTLDAAEALDQFWDCGRVRRTLASLMARHQYDFVFTLLPRDSTHGHHQAATLLALQAVEAMPESRRPVVLAAEPGQTAELIPYSCLSGAPITQALVGEPASVFERTRSFGFENALRYDIVVNWVISEHKSQGMFQNDWGRHDVERFWLLALGPADAVERTRRLLQILFKPATGGRA